MSHFLVARCKSCRRFIRKDSLEDAAMCQYCGEPWQGTQEKTPTTAE